MRVYIFGTGKGKDYVLRCLRDDAKVIAYIDNYCKDISNINNVPIVNQKEIRYGYDYIIVSLMIFDDVLSDLINEGVENDRIIPFFSMEAANVPNYWEVIDQFKWRTELLWKKFNECILPLTNNINYELYSDEMMKNGLAPQILSAEKAIEKIVDERCSMVRFGDNEFEQIRGNERVNYQDIDARLATRLEEVLNCDDKRLIVAIADNYGSLFKYTDEAANDIRSYLTSAVRNDHMNILDLNREYYDAYISRPYLIYRDKESAGRRFEKIKRIWNNEDVLVVEGSHTRFGVGNDLLCNARNVHRILCPDKNAFLIYEKIYEKALKYGKNRLVLIILGPTATIMAYDLAMNDYWAVDIGQLDTEYEWYLRGAQRRCLIPNKTVSEINRYDDIVTDENDMSIKKYYSEVIEEISL